MSRKLYLDAGFGETRAVVTLDGRPERLLIERSDDIAVQALGARIVARVRKLDRVLASAFLDLGRGPDALLALKSDMPKFAEGAAIEVEIRTEARGDKGATARFIGLAEGKPRLLTAAPALEAQLQEIEPKARIVTGPEARSMADLAQAEALETVFPLPGGGDVAVEATRALTAVDVDLGARTGAESKKASRQANLAALATAARVLRLKGLGGLVVIDLVGRGHDGQALLAAARLAFAPDNPGVAIGPIGRFGTLELTIPRRRRPGIDRLVGADGRITAESQGYDLLRALEREAAANPGARLTARCAPDVAEAAKAHLAALVERFGGRLAITADSAYLRDRMEIVST